MLAPDIWAVVVFLTVVVVSCLARERLYPFSLLGMFNHPYNEQPVVLFEDVSGNGVYPSAQVIGSPTSGISREYAIQMAEGLSREAFARYCRRRADLQRDCPRPKSSRISVWLIAVDKSGKVIMRRDWTSPPL